MNGSLIETTSDIGIDFVVLKEGKKNFVEKFFFFSKKEYLPVNLSYSNHPRTQSIKMHVSVINQVEWASDQETSYHHGQKCLI